MSVLNSIKLLNLFSDSIPSFSSIPTTWHGHCLVCLDFVLSFCVFSSSLSHIVLRMKRRFVIIFLCFFLPYLCLWACCNLWKMSAKIMLRPNQAAGHPCLSPCIRVKEFEYPLLQCILHLVSPYSIWNLERIIEGKPMIWRIFHTISLSTESYAFAISRKARYSGIPFSLHVCWISFCSEYHVCSTCVWSKVSIKIIFCEMRQQGDSSLVFA